MSIQNIKELMGQASRQSFLFCSWDFHLLFLWFDTHFCFAQRDCLIKVERKRAGGGGSG